VAGRGINSVAKKLNVSETVLAERREVKIEDGLSPSLNQFGSAKAETNQIVSKRSKKKQPLPVKSSGAKIARH